MAQNLRISVDGRNLTRPGSGISRYLVEMCDALGALGHEIILHLPCEPHPLAQRPRRADIRQAKLNGSVARHFWAAAMLPRDVARVKPDVFWGPAHRLPPLPANIAACLTIHDLVWLRAPQTMRFLPRLAERFLMPPAIRRADAIAAVSNATANDVAAAFPHVKERTKVVWPAFGPKTEPARSEALTRIGVRQPYVLFVGTNEPRKDLATLVAAFAMLPAQILSATQLVIAGSEGWKTRPAPRLAEQAGIADRVIVTGHVGDDVLQALYAHARCLAMPSLLEGFGLPVVEAQRLGVPVVVSDAGSLPDVAGQGALVVPVADTCALARALADMIRDYRLHSDLSASASENALRFLDARSALQMETLFRQAINQRQAGG